MSQMQKINKIVKRVFFLGLSPEVSTTLAVTPLLDGVTNAQMFVDSKQPSASL